MMYNLKIFENIFYICREFLHWLVAYKSDDTKRILMEFMPSSPPLGSKLHRYVFLTFVIPDHHLDDLQKVTSRSHFQIVEYLKQNNLNGTTVSSVNFYLTERK